MIICDRVHKTQNININITVLIHIFLKKQRNTSKYNLIFPPNDDNDLKSNDVQNLNPDKTDRIGINIKRKMNMLKQNIVILRTKY